MHDINIDEMINKLAADGIISDKDKPEAVESLKAHWEDKIAVIWCVDDVIERASERDLKLSRTTAIEVLNSMQRGHDCELGITWITIDCHIDNIINGTF